MFKWLFPCCLESNSIIYFFIRLTLCADYDHDHSIEIGEVERALCLAQVMTRNSLTHWFHDCLVHSGSSSSSSSSSSSVSPAWSRRETILNVLNDKAPEFVRDKCMEMYSKHCPDGAAREVKTGNGMHSECKTTPTANTNHTHDDDVMPVWLLNVIEEVRKAILLQSSHFFQYLSSWCAWYYSYVCSQLYFHSFFPVHSPIHTPFCS